MTRTPALLFSLGIPPQQRTLLGGDQPLNEVLHQRLLRLIDVHPNTTNYFAWQALGRSYVGPGDKCLPLYLQQSRFAEMGKGAGLVTPVHAWIRRTGWRRTKSARCGTPSTAPVMKAFA
jgi:S-adenosylmethionine-diacylglycerol 3-amino-3-carboxypropyl transferase